MRIKRPSSRQLREAFVRGYKAAKRRINEAVGELSDPMPDISKERNRRKRLASQYGTDHDSMVEQVVDYLYVLSGEEDSSPELVLDELPSEAKSCSSEVFGDAWEGYFFENQGIYDGVDEIVEDGVLQYLSNFSLEGDEEEYFLYAISNGVKKVVESFWK